MRNFFKPLFKITILLLLALQAQAFQKLATYRDFDSSRVGSRSWVIFDVDNTLIHPKGMIGSVEWAEYMKTRYIQAGFTPDEAFKKQNELFAMTQEPTAQVIDYAIFPLLRKLPNSANAFALTARSPALSVVTLQQLMSTSLVGTFESRFPQLSQKPQDLVIDRGVIFANGKDKGEILETLLKNALEEPKEIYFFDDKDYNVTAFDQAMERINSTRIQKIKSQSFLFTGANPEIQKFDPKKADVLWYQFRYLKADDYFDQKQILKHPDLLAKALFSQQAATLASFPWDTSCQVKSQSGSSLQTECIYQDCLEWKMDYNDEQQCLRMDEPHAVTFPLSYLSDLGIYNRSGWEFLK